MWVCTYLCIDAVCMYTHLYAYVHMYSHVVDQIMLFKYTVIHILQLTS